VLPHNIEINVTTDNSDAFTRWRHPKRSSGHPVTAYYSFIDLERMSWLSWLTCSGWFTHISGHPSATDRAQDRESSPTKDRRYTTVPRNQLQQTLSV